MFTGSCALFGRNTWKLPCLTNAPLPPPPTTTPSPPFPTMVVVVVVVVEEEEEEEESWRPSGLSGGIGEGDVAPPLLPPPPPPRVRG